MRSEWQSYQLGELFELTNGFAFKGSDFISSGVPVIKIKNVKPNSLLLGDLAYVDTAVADKRPDKQLKRGDILITMSGNRMDGSRDTWVGKVAYFDIPGRYMLNQRVGVLRPKKGVEVDCKCCAYFLSSDEFQDFFIAVATSSGGQANLSPSQILGEKISLPPLEEQERIASLLTALDDRITLLRETNATLEAIAQALFKSWFVDFDPVRAKMEGRTPEGMDEATAALFPDGLEMSELGEVPRGWRVMPFSTIVSVTSGKRPEDRADSPSSTIAVPLYGGAGVMGYTSSSLFDVPKILTGRVGTLGKVQIAYPPFWASDNVLVVTPKNQLFFSFAYQWLRLIDVAALNRGSTKTLLTQRDLCAQKGVVPPSQTLEAFEGVATSLNARILANAKQAENLSILRDTLLPRLISGQLRLPEAQAAVEGAL